MMPSVFMCYGQEIAQEKLVEYIKNNKELEEQEDEIDWEDIDGFNLDGVMRIEDKYFLHSKVVEVDQGYFEPLVMTEKDVREISRLCIKYQVEYTGCRLCIYACP